MMQAWNWLSGTGITFNCHPTHILRNVQCSVNLKTYWSSMVNLKEKKKCLGILGQSKEIPISRWWPSQNATRSCGTSCSYPLNPQMMNSWTAGLIHRPMKLSEKEKVKQKSLPLPVRGCSIRPVSPFCKRKRDTVEKPWNSFR